jgi:hypothetical protein
VGAWSLCMCGFWTRWANICVSGDDHAPGMLHTALQNLPACHLSTHPHPHGIYAYAGTLHACIAYHAQQCCEVLHQLLSLGVADSWLHMALQRAYKPITITRIVHPTHELCDCHATLWNWYWRVLRSEPCTKASHAGFMVGLVCRLSSLLLAVGGGSSLHVHVHVVHQHRQ